MICRDDLELRWQLLTCENEFSDLLFQIDNIMQYSAETSMHHTMNMPHFINHDNNIIVPEHMMMLIPATISEGGAS